MLVDTPWKMSRRWDKFRRKHLGGLKIKLLCCKKCSQSFKRIFNSVNFCRDEFLGEWRLFTEQRGQEEKLGGLSCSVTAAMPSGRRFEEDTWDQRTWTMSWGVTLNWDEPLFIPHALLLLFFPISLLSSFIYLCPLWSPSLFSLHNLIYPCTLFSQSFDSPPLSLSLSHFPLMPSPSGHRHANASGSLSVSMTHIITYLTISTPTFFCEIHHLEGKSGPSPSWDIPAFLQWLFSLNWGLTFCSAASSCMTQWHRSSGHVTMESQRYGVVAKAPLSNTHLIPHRYCWSCTGRREGKETGTGVCMFESQAWSNSGRLKRRTEDQETWQPTIRKCVSATLSSTVALFKRPLVSILHTPPICTLPFHHSCHLW